MKTKKNQIWNFNNEIDAEVCGEGVKRKILAYADEMMCVENHFEKGAIGALHHHPHTQITYVVSGQFEFTINGEKKIVNPGDALLKRDSRERTAGASLSRNMMNRSWSCIPNGNIRLCRVLPLQR